MTGFLTSSTGRKPDLAREYDDGTDDGEGDTDWAYNSAEVVELGNCSQVGTGPPLCEHASKISHSSALGIDMHRTPSYLHSMTTYLM